MDLLKNSKVLGGIAVLAVVLLGYFAYSSLSSTPTTSSDQSPISQNLLLALSNLHTIRLDGSIFQSPTFQSLSDFGVTIPPEPAGRRNPFEPVGGSQNTSSTNKTAGH